MKIVQGAGTVTTGVMHALLPVHATRLVKLLTSGALDALGEPPPPAAPAARVGVFAWLDIEERKGCGIELFFPQKKKVFEK